VKPRVPARDERSHEVELDARADATFTGLVRVSVMRRNRAQAKSDRALVLSAGAARELMKRAGGRRRGRPAGVPAGEGTAGESDSSRFR
jgi:hypothetical protein